MGTTSTETEEIDECDDCDEDAGARDDISVLSISVFGETVLARFSSEPNDNV
jgi:hypothetical protein